MVMNQTSPTLVPMGVFTLVAMVLLAAAVTRVMVARQRAARRIVEQPNSQYTWERVREKEHVSLWTAIDLDALHEINREEVRRLLAQVEVSGSESLRKPERTFLDSLLAR
jgi:hypothetical protein